MFNKPNYTIKLESDNEILNSLNLIKITINKSILIIMNCKKQNSKSFFTV